MAGGGTDRALLLLGISALAGGVAMVFGVGGESMLPERGLMVSRSSTAG